MSLTDYIPSLSSEDNGADELEQLRQLFAKRESGFDLTGVYGRPYPSTQVEDTIVFPVTVYSGGGEYAATAKEFVIPDSGFEDQTGPLPDFLRQVTGTEEEVGFDDIVAVEGTEVNVELNGFGELVVGETPLDE